MTLSKSENGSVFGSWLQLPSREEVTQVSVEESRIYVTQMIQHYFENLGPDGEWSGETLHDRASDFKQLMAVGTNVRCPDLAKSHLRQFINSAPTAARARHFKGILGTFLRWGAATGYLSDEQGKLATSLRWGKPKGFVAIPNRRDQAKSHDPLPSGAPRGNVPSHSQISAWAKKCAERYAHGEGLIHTGANLGLRSAELRLLTADSRVALQGRGNLVKIDSGEVYVRFQIGRFANKLPKGSKQRDVVIPSVDMILTGFDLRQFLATCSIAALAEQKNGSNPDALIFPNSNGKVWEASSLRKSVWGPAAEDLGWKMKSYARGDGRNVSMFRFTLHSLRDRFATTAVSEWGYAENQLLEQGSWEDSETVRRFYAGVTDDTHSDVRKLHGLLGT
jgi:hypothetical protein